MEWLTEGPTYSIMLGLLLTSFFALMWFIFRKRILLSLPVLAFLTMIAAIVAGQWIVTDREQLKQNIFDLAKAVQANDVSTVLQFVSQQVPNTRTRIENEMPNYDFRKCRVIGFNYVEISEDSNEEATVNFVVGFNVDATQTYGYDGSGTRRVTLTFKKEGDHWKIIDYQHEHPQSRKYINL